MRALLTWGLLAGAAFCLPLRAAPDEQLAALLAELGQAYERRDTPRLVELQARLALQAPASDEERLQAQLWQGVALAWQLDLPAARAALEGALASVAGPRAATGAALVAARELLNLLIEDGELAEARQQVGRLAQLLDPARTGRLPAWLHLDDARLRLREGRAELALAAADAARAAAAGANQPREQAAAWLLECEVHETAGRPVEALAAARAALELAVDERTRLVAGGALAWQLRSLGRADEARRQAGNVLAAAEACGDRLLLIKALLLRATLAADTGGTGEADALLQRAEALLTDGTPPAVRATLLSARAELAGTGSPDYGPRLEQALQLAAVAGDHALAARVASQLTALRWIQRDLRGADAHARRQQSAARLAGDAALELMAANNVADISLRLGQPDLDLARANVRAADELRHWELRVDCRLTLAELALHATRLDEADRALEEAEEAVEQGLADLDHAQAAGLRARFAILAALGQQLAGQQLAAAEDEPQRARAVQQGFVHASRWKGRALAEARRSAQPAPPGPWPSATPEQARALLPDDATVLVDWFADLTHVGAYVLGRAGLERHVLCPRDEARDLARRAAEAARDAALAPAEATARLSAAHARLLAPLLPPGTRRLLLQPCAEIADCPFAALVTAPADAPADRPRFLIEDCELQLGPSVTTLLELLAAPPPDSAPGRRLLVLGDPAAGSGTLAPLPGARAECRAIAALQTSGAVTLLLGAEASKERFLREAPEADGIHLATHGLLDDTDPTRSALVLAPTPTHPDGLLTVDEVLRLKLRARTVVLAACDAAAGSYLGGEGTQSLARAFLLAGARSVVAGHWPIDDSETAAVSTEFHRLLAAGRPVAQALREAQLSRLNAGPASAASARGERLAPAPAGEAPWHPRRWAGLVLVGAGD